MMWGRWQTFGTMLRRRKSKPIELPEKDRRERARIVVEGAAAILLSAPIFNVGEGDPYDVIEILPTLGPDALPYHGPFDRAEFLSRLLATEHKNETIGAALLNQRIVAGLGNYLRAEILFNCKLNPWLTVDKLTSVTSHVCQKQFRVWRITHTNGALRPLKEIGKEWQPMSPWYINWAANMARDTWSFGERICRVCAVGKRSDKLRQRTIQTEENDEERTRIVYFCAECQDVTLQDLHD
jgi:endonuclease VIII